MKLENYSQTSKKATLLCHLWELLGLLLSLLVLDHMGLCLGHRVGFSMGRQLGGVWKSHLANNTPVISVYPLMVFELAPLVKLEITVGARKGKFPRV